MDEDEYTQFRQDTLDQVEYTQFRQDTIDQVEYTQFRHDTLDQVEYTQFRHDTIDQVEYTQFRHDTLDQVAYTQFRHDTIDQVEYMQFRHDTIDQVEYTQFRHDTLDQVSNKPNQYLRTKLCISPDKLVYKTNKSNSIRSSRCNRNKVLHSTVVYLNLIRVNRSARLSGRSDQITYIFTSIEYYEKVRWYITLIRA